MKLAEVVETSLRVSEASGRLDKVDRLAALLARTPAAEIEIATAYLSGSLRQEKIGIAWAALRSAMPEGGADSSSLELAEVDAVFDRISKVSGKGSAAEKTRLLRELLVRATPDEQRFLTGLVMGELRQGALEGLVLEAVAKASGVPAGEVRRAWMMSGDLAVVAQTALVEGVAGLSRFSTQL
ncbi:MAG: ATP-dependent DNA ligase, partial [candidate division NC10 bacterium]|nr:ATP-dependent DNA ligase [candidate division NC10 bacterium]